MQLLIAVLRAAGSADNRLKALNPWKNGTTEAVKNDPIRYSRHIP